MTEQLNELENVTVTSLKEIFVHSADIIFQNYRFNEHSVTFITCQAMIDDKLFYQVVMKELQTILSQVPETEDFADFIESNLYVPKLQKVIDKDMLITEVYRGAAVIFFEDAQLLYLSDIADKPNRTPEETKTEMPVKGPRDNFIEDLAVNIALVRKRVPTNSLCVETLTVGRRTKTDVALLYFDDIVNEEILQGLTEKINSIDTDIIFSGDELMEYVDKRNFLFPLHDYTGRPDFAVQSLARGRIVIIVDGVTYAMVTPINIFYLLKTGEDYEYPTVFNSFERLIRLLGVMIGIFLPGFWLSLTTYHQDQLPLQLLATVVQANTGLPLPIVLEMLLMLIVFELFREAGLRLPEAIGSTLGVVGGVIIGDAAIRAGITSPAMVVIIAISVISSYTLFNQSFVSTVSMLRIFVILLSSVLGLFGFFMSIMFIVYYIASIRTFGVPYLNIAADLKWAATKKTLIRENANKYTDRPTMLKVTDKTRQPEVKE